MIVLYGVHVSIITKTNVNVLDDYLNMISSIVEIQHLGNCCDLISRVVLNQWEITASGYSSVFDVVYEHILEFLLPLFTLFICGSSYLNYPS